MINGHFSLSHTYTSGLPSQTRDRESGPAPVGLPSSAAAGGGQGTGQNCTTAQGERSQVSSVNV